MNVCTADIYANGLLELQITAPGIHRGRTPNGRQSWLTTDLQPIDHDGHVADCDHQPEPPVWVPVKGKHTFPPTGASKGVFGSVVPGFQSMRPRTDLTGKRAYPSHLYIHAEGVSDSPYSRFVFNVWPRIVNTA